MENKILNIATGHELCNLLNLKLDKTGKIKTSFGAKSIEGLGACIQIIIEEQKTRLK